MSEQVLTKKGYDFYEVSSAFQKSIRRCLEEDALYWGIELYDSGYKDYCWKRMVIMCSEDVGLGEPSTIVQMMALKESFEYLQRMKDYSAMKLPFTHAIVLLCRSRKSRYIDHAITVHWQNHAEEIKGIPDWAYDMHTRKGKFMGRGLQYFYQESCKISNANKLTGEEALEKEAWRVDGIYGGIDREDEPVKDSAYLAVKKNYDDSPTLF